MRSLRGRAALGTAALGVAAALLGAPAPASAGVPATAPVDAAAVTYRATELGMLDGDGWAEALAVNEKGHAVGYIDEHAVLWRDGKVIDLGLLPGGMYSQALDINERDEVVGYAEYGGAPHAFLWKNGRMRDLGTLPGGGKSSAAQGINDNGDIVGWASPPDNEYVHHAVRWRSGRIIDMDPSGVFSAADDITNSGWIIGAQGTPEDPVNPNAVAWWWNGRTTILNVGGASGVNERFEVVGQDERGRSFYWSRGTSTTLQAPSGTESTDASDINKWSRIAGSMGQAPGIWYNGAFTELPWLPGSTASVGRAKGINDRNQVVGSATAPGGYTHHAVLWTPEETG